MFDECRTCGRLVVVDAYGHCESCNRDRAEEQADADADDYGESYYDEVDLYSLE